MGRLYNNYEKEAVSTINSKTYKSAFINTFVTQISNPKAIIFFVALLPQFINSKGNILLQFSILAGSHIFMETLILMSYGWIGAKGTNTFKDNKLVIKWIDRIGGGVLIGIGLNLYFLKRG